MELRWNHGLPPPVNLLLIYALIVIIFETMPLLAQGGVDEYEADDAATDMMEHDPNIINPQNSEGYGTNIQTTINNKSGILLMKSMLRYIFTYYIPIAVVLIHHVFLRQYFRRRQI